MLMSTLLFCFLWICLALFMVPATGDEAEHPLIALLQLFYAKCNTNNTAVMHVKLQINQKFNHASVVV